METSRHIWVNTIAGVLVVVVAGGVGYVIDESGRYSALKSQVSGLESRVSGFDTSDLPVHAKQLERLDAQLRTMREALDSASLSTDDLVLLKRRLGDLQDAVRAVSADRVGRAEAGVSDLTSRVAALEERSSTRGGSIDPVLRARIDTAIASAASSKEEVRGLGSSVASLESQLAARPWSQACDALGAEIEKLKGRKANPRDSLVVAELSALSRRVKALESKITDSPLGDSSPVEAPRKPVKSVTVDGLKLNLLSASAGTGSVTLELTITSIKRDRSVRLVAPGHGERFSRAILSTGDELTSGNVSASGRRANTYRELHFDLVLGIPARVQIEFEGRVKPPALLRVVQVRFYDPRAGGVNTATLRDVATR